MTRLPAVRLRSDLPTGTVHSNIEPEGAFPLPDVGSGPVEGTEAS